MMTACVVVASPEGGLCRRCLSVGDLREVFSRFWGVFSRIGGGLMLFAGCGLNSDSAVTGRRGLICRQQRFGFLEVQS
jgi:hypothetical protein